MSGSVNLDIIFNFINNKSSIKKSIDELKKKYSKSFEEQGFYSNAIKRNIMAEKEAIKEISAKIKEIVSSYEKLNAKGQLSYLFDTGRFKRWRKDQKRLNPEQMKEFLGERVPEDLKAEEQQKKKAAQEEKKQIEQTEKEEEKNKKEERKNQEEIAKNIVFQRKLEIKRSLQHSKALDENKKRDESLRKKQWMLMLGKWGRLGIWGIVAQQAIKYISKAVGYAYNTSMQGLDWERTIRGGAAGGTWFGQGLAAYQRAGIGANRYQGFKRGLQGYLGSVKLGMGNAAPLMYLGLSALGSPDELEKQMERSLRRLPKDVSLALAGQMGLDYNMWEAIYSGRLERQKSAYSEEAIRKWSELADGFNELLTRINTFIFNYIAPFAGAFGEFLKRLAEGKTGIGQSIDAGMGFIPKLTRSITFGTLEIVVKNEKGEVLQKSEVQASTEDAVRDAGVQIYTI